MPPENDDLSKLDRGDDVTPANADVKTAEQEAEEARLKLGEEELAKAKAKADADKEDDGEDEETEDERAEREAAEKAEQEDEERKKRARVPLKRHEEILKRNREEAARREQALLQQIRELQSARGEQQQKNTLNEMSTELEELQDKYEDLVLDGKRDEARAVRRQIGEMQNKISDFRAATFSKAARQEAIETLKYEAALAKAESEYPEINPDNADAFDEALTEEVADLTEALMKSQKLPRHDAFAKAARYVLGVPKKPEDVAKQRQSEDAAKRTEDARRKAASAAARQAPDTSQAGKDADKGGKSGSLDVMRMTQTQFKEFAEKDEAALAAARGDTL